MNTQASLAQLQASGTAKPEFIAPIELSYRGSGRQRLIYLSALMFVLGFAANQLTLILPESSDKLFKPGAVFVVPAESEHRANTYSYDQPAEPAELVAPVDVVVVTEQSAVPPPIVNELPAVEKDPLALPAQTTEAEKAAEDRLALKQMQLALLQRNALLALERDRLLTPQHDNAVYYYQSMLALDANNTVALDGLQAVAARYVEFAQRLRARGDTSGARIMLANAESVWPGSAANEPSAFHKQPQQQLTSMAPENRVPQKASAPDVQPSASSRRARLMAQATSLSQSGQHQAVVALLEPESEILASDSRLLTALHAAYLASGQESKARELSARADLNEVDANMLRAQEWLSQQNYVQAISQLEVSPPTAAENPEYFTLLAGLYYQTGRHQDSQTLYRELLKQDDTNGRWWLGYAVTSDALNHADALVAYRGALKYLSQSDTARAYAEQRVGQLSVNQGGAN